MLSRLSRPLVARCPPAAARHYSAHTLKTPKSSISTIADLKRWENQASAPYVEVCGWVRSVRKSSAVRFVDITDGSSMRPLQAVVDKQLASDLRPGAAVRLRGKWHNQPAPSSAPPDSPAVRQSSISELRVDQVEVLATSDPQTYPIQNKYQTPESLRTIPHLRMRTPLNSTLLRLRSDATALVTQFFFQEKFQQFHPPLITSSDCEGAGEAFHVKSGSPEEFFRDPKYLTVSSQLHLEAVAQALGNVWTLSPTFRAEQSDTSRHLSEFYMLEAEMSFTTDMDQVMNLLQNMLSSLTSGLRDLHAASELFQNRLDARDPAEREAFEDLEHADVLERRWNGLTTSKRWPRITYTEAIGELQRVAGSFEHAPVWGSGLQSEHEKYLAEKIGYDEETGALMPVYVTQYPRAIKAFYMAQSAASSSSRGDTVDCFDLLVPQLGELAGGSMREHGLEKLEDNMRYHGLEVPQRGAANGNSMNWYLDLRRWGCPPHGGFGLGFDRLLSYLTGVRNVRDIVPFPRHYQRCDC